MKDSFRYRGVAKETEKPDADNRIIVLSDEIDEEVCGEIIQRILDINLEDEKKDGKKGFKREPIRVVINTMGGSVYDGLGVVDCIENSKTPIHTICYGQAMSMGFVIFTAGHYRISGKRSTFMYHELAYPAAYEKLETHRQDLKESERIQEVCDDLLVSKSKLTKRKLLSVRNKKIDWYMSAQEALDLQIVDQIL